MKKALVAIAVAFVVIGAASAQPWYQPNQPWQASPGQNWNNMQGRGYGYGYNQQAPALKAEKISLEGKLELVDLRVAIVQDGKTYFLGIPQRLFGFIPGLVEGASVKVEGSSLPLNAKDSFVVHLTTLTIGDKTIDLSKTAGFAGGMGRGQVGGMGMVGGRGCW